MILAVLMAIQSPPLIESEVPTSSELSALEAREKARYPIILKLCREAAASRDWRGHISRFADQHGLSAFGKLSLTTSCSLYRSGLSDAQSRRRASRR